MVCSNLKDVELPSPWEVYQRKSRFQVTVSHVILRKESQFQSFPDMAVKTLQQWQAG